MTYESAAHMSTYIDTQDRLAADPDFLAAVRKATDLTRERWKADGRPKSTSGSLLNAVIGGVIGYTAASTAAKSFDLSPTFSSRLKTTSAVAGALMAFNKTGSRTKTAATHAIRIGFLRAFEERGLLKEGALLVDPANVMSLPRSMAESASKMVNAAGTAVGAFTAPSSGDEDMLKLKLQKDLLRQKLKAALVDRENRKIRAALAR